MDTGGSGGAGECACVAAAGNCAAGRGAGGVDAGVVKAGIGSSDAGGDRQDSRAISKRAHRLRVLLSALLRPVPVPTPMRRAISSASSVMPSGYSSRL
ncbi:MAG: hypothetical protein M1399_08880 [Actinobacteria bacterium]|nr:hypothetical protein [Actinomycetota bacterium]